MRLRQVQLTNFRTHKNRTIDLHPRITTICGASFKGKSTIIRALRWAMLNQPHGKAMLRWGSTFAKVVLHMDSGVSVMRFRGGSKNVYKIKRPNGVEELAGLKRGVAPEPVANLLNVGPENFQDQHDQPFMLSKGSPHVARHLNRIVALELIDKLQAKLGKQSRAANNTVGEYKADVAALEDQCNTLAFVPGMVKAYKRIQRQQKVIATHMLQCEAIDSTIKELTTLRKFICKPPNIAQLTTQHDKITKLQADAKALHQQISILRDAAAITNKRKTEYQKTKARYDKLLQGRCPICGRLNNVKTK